MIKPAYHKAGVCMTSLWTAVQARAATNPPITTGLTNLSGMDSSLPDTGLSVLRVMGALILVLGLFGLAVWFLRRTQKLGFRLGPTPQLRVLETRSLSYRHSLYVIAYDNQRFLVGASPGALSLLSELPPLDPATASPAPTATFTDTLRQILRRKS
jgi:flagellar biosynthetic protein FliO